MIRSGATDNPGLETTEDTQTGAIYAFHPAVSRVVIDGGRPSLCASGRKSHLTAVGRVIEPDRWPSRSRNG